MWYNLAASNLLILRGLFHECCQIQVKTTHLANRWPEFFRKEADLLYISVLELMGFASPDLIQKINELTTEGVSYLHEQIEFAEYHWGRK